MVDRDEAPYARIAATLRARIEAGELPPGARVPSTREITREWGVAMATATKVLTTLRHEGLVRAVPGVGTVVDGGHRPAAGSRSEAPPPRRAGAEVSLAPERIVAAGIAIADAEGLAALSMRRVAADLDVAVMSLYRHVADKDDLVVRMMDAAMAERSFPVERPDGWRPRLELAAQTLWSAFRAHQWLAPAMSLTRPQPTPAALAYVEWVLAALDEAGFDLASAFETHLALFSFVRGAAVDVGHDPEGPSVEEWMATQHAAVMAIVAGGCYPTFERLMAARPDYEVDAVFERGLRHLLDGLAVSLPAN